jgi:hypothetical protein
MADQLNHFPVVGGKDVNDILSCPISIGLGHDGILLWISGCSGTLRGPSYHPGSRQIHDMPP